MKNPFGDLAVDINDFGDSPFVEQGGTLADRNFNPGNLRFVGQSGAVEGEKGFAKFESYDAGYDALKRQINLDGSRGLKLGEFISKYAPSSENNTSAYQKFVAKQTGYDLESKVSELDADVLAGAIVKQEGGSYGGKKNNDVNPFGDAAVNPFGDEAVQEKSGKVEYKPVTPYTTPPNSFTLNRLKNDQEIDEKDYERMNRSLLEQANKGKEGVIKEGNIDLYNRPKTVTETGETATVRSMSIGTDKGEVLIPTVSDSGELLTPDQAVQLYEKTGKHLGVFGSVDAANRYAEQLHLNQAELYSKGKFEDPMSVGKISYQQEPEQGESIESDLTEFDRFKGNLKTGAAGVASSTVKAAGATADYLRALDEKRKAERQPGIVGDFEKRGDLTAEGIERAKDISKSAKEYAGIVDKAFSDMPEREGAAGFYDSLVQNAPQLFSQIGANVIGGAPLGTAVMGAQILGGKYSKLTEENEVEPIRAFQASLADAVVESRLEQLGFNKAMKFWKPSAASTKMIRDMVETFGTDWLTEFTQSFVDSATDIWGRAVKDNKSPSEQVDQFVQDFAATAAKGSYEGLTSATLSMLSPGAKIAANGLQKVVKELPGDVQTRVREFIGLESNTVTPWRMDKESLDSLTETDVPEGFTRVYRIVTPGEVVGEAVYTDDPVMLKKQATEMGITNYNIDSTDYELVGVDVPTESVDKLRSGELKNEFVLSDEIVQMEISSMKEAQGESSQEEEMVEAESTDVPAGDDKFEPDKVFVSKKGNYYERVNGVWFDSEGEEVVDGYKLRAAEKGMRDYVAPTAEEQAEVDTGVGSVVSEVVGQEDGNVEQIRNMFGDLPEQGGSAFGGVAVEDVVGKLKSEIELEPGKGIEQVEQAAQITPESLAERVNQSTPDLDLKFDGVFDRTALNKTPLYQFTPQSGEFKGRTIAVDELSEEAVVGKLSGMGFVAERSKIDPLSEEENKPQDAKFKSVDVTSKQFVNWFNKSKAVTKDNKPERVFHGTADVFNTFEHDMPNKKDSGWLGKGFYFSNSPTIASAYTNLKAGNAPNIIPAYLSIQNPYYATMEEKDTLKNSSAEEQEAWSNDLQSKGYDGVILESKGGIRELVAFENTQIKSSISNTGEFSKKRGSILYSGLDPVGAVKGAMDLVKSATGAAANFLEPNSTGKLRMTGEAFQEAFLDPERIMKRDPYAKKAFIALINAEESKNAFLYRNWEEYKKAVGGIKSGSKEAMRIGQALDGKLNPGELFKEERRAYDFFKQNYEALITEYAQRTAGSKEAYERILNAVKTGSMKKTLVKDLVGEDKSNYWRLREEIKDVYNGRLLKDVTAEEAAKIDALKVEQRGILHNDWRKKLPENEANVYDILSRKVTDYLPRMFNPEEVKTAFMAELAAAKKALAKTTNKATETKLKDAINKYEKALKTMSGGGMVTFDQLPSSIFFKFFSPRVGKEGYSFDAIKAYESYLFGIAKKIFDEPTVKKIGKEYYDKIEDVSVKRYTNDLVRHYLGLDKSDFDWIAGQIATFEWMRTLGLNPRSALVNLSQRLNTVMYAGEKYSLLAQADMTAELASGGLHKSEASKAFDESGIAREVPNVMTEGDTPNNLEWIKSKVGFMFNAVELSNRKHAFIAGYLKAKAAGESIERCMQMGQKTVHKTQFRYGKLGMPKVFWNPIARVGMQFSSYTMKQAQFVYDLADGFKTAKGIIRFMKYVMYTQGIAWTLKEFLDADMSSAIGLNISWGSAMKGIVALVEGDWEALARHFKMTFNDGEGPVQGIAGPAVTGTYSVWEGSKKGEGMKALMKEVTPVIVDRARAFLNAEQRKDGTWVLKGQSNNAMYNLTTKQLVQRTLGPKSAEETRVQRKFKEEEMLGAEKTRGTKAVVDALLSGDKEKFRNAFKDNETAMLVIMSQKGMFEKMVEAELMKRKFTQEEMERFKNKPSSKQVFNALRKGET